jgi:hypothetical protein
MRQWLGIGLLLLAGCGESRSPGAAVPLDQLPAGYLDTARKTLPEVKFDTAWKLSNGNYEIRGKNKAGKVREVELSPTGAVVEIE